MKSCANLTYKNDKILIVESWKLGNLDLSFILITGHLRLIKRMLAMKQHEHDDRQGPNID